MKRIPLRLLVSWELWQEPNGQYLRWETGDQAPCPVPGSQLLTTFRAAELT